MNYLFFDTETTGVKPEYDNLVQLAAILTDSEGEELATMDYIIYPDEFLITPDNAAIHGITHQRAVKEGIKLQIALTRFLELVAQSDCLVAHNLSFDVGFISEELDREDMGKEAKTSGFYKKKTHCTMQTTTDFVALDWNAKYKTFKWPRLEQLHYKLFDTGFEGAHNALVDVRALIRCFFVLRNKHGFYVAGKKDKKGGYSNRNI